MTYPLRLVVDNITKRIAIKVGEKVVWEGSLSEWTYALAHPTQGPVPPWEASDAA